MCNPPPFGKGRQGGFLAVAAEQISQSIKTFKGDLWVKK
jgi:hypothetical protein